ncbi:MAG: YkgJ family cysteine cluster protein, partial [Cyanobacteria bacterium HKST-UBA04]|nr:YkgJ family cysteine cluster protein [Cyanobacteria bacterium HKST-UBA04]
ASKENALLAERCMTHQAACCKQGQLFLPAAEYERLLAWVQANAPDEAAEFIGRIAAYDGFYLYHQRTRCQFLDPQNLCRLHHTGTKPSECFWWPLHVYVNANGQLDIRAASYCCNAAEHLQPDADHVQTLIGQVQQLDPDLIRRYRAVYPGLAQDKRLLAEVPPVKKLR